MTSLLQAACNDVREAASYAKEPMPMSTEEAIRIIRIIHDAHLNLSSRKELQKALTLAISALRAQAEPGPQRDYEADIAILTKQRDASETQRCEWVRTARAAERRAELLERALRLALDAIDETGAGL